MTACELGLPMRCPSLRRDGLPCHATATWGRLYCPRHDPTARWRPTGYPQAVRDLALNLYQQVGPAEAARQTGVKAGTIRVWAGTSGRHQLPAQAVRVGAGRATWPATLAAQHFAERRRSERRIAEVEREVAALGHDGRRRSRRRALPC